MWHRGKMAAFLVVERKGRACWLSAAAWLFERWSRKLAHPFKQGQCRIQGGYQYLTDAVVVGGVMLSLRRSVTGGSASTRMVHFVRERFGSAVKCKNDVVLCSHC